MVKSRPLIIVAVILLGLIALFVIQQYRANTQVEAFVAVVNDAGTGVSIDRGEAELWSGEVILKEISMETDSSAITIRKMEMGLGFSDMVRLAIWGVNDLAEELREVNLRAKDLNLTSLPGGVFIDELNVDVYGLRDLRGAFRDLQQNRWPRREIRFAGKFDSISFDQPLETMTIPESLKQVEIEAVYNPMQEAIQLGTLKIDDPQIDLNAFGLIPLSESLSSFSPGEIRLNIRSLNVMRIKIPVSDEVGSVSFTKLAISGEVDGIYPLNNVELIDLELNADSAKLFPPEPLTSIYQPLVAFAGYDGRPLPVHAVQGAIAYDPSVPMGYELSFESLAGNAEWNGQMALNPDSPMKSLFVGPNKLYISELNPQTIRLINQVGVFFNKRMIESEANSFTLRVYGSLTKPGFSLN